MTHHSFLQLAPALALITLASCGANDGAANRAQAGATVENMTLTSLGLTSTAFQDGHPLPSQFTCDGAGQSPPLSWDEPPAGTRSFALVVDDPDAPSGTFGHWGMFNVPASARSIAGGQSIGTEVTNDFGKPGYGAPCPPKGTGPHHYRFKLYALRGDGLSLNSHSKIAELDREAAARAIATAQLVGTYERK